MKVRSALIYTDRNGKDWVCESIGKKISYACYDYLGWEENLIAGLQKHTNDSTIRIESVKFTSNPEDEEITLVDTGSTYYFVKRFDNNHFKAFVTLLDSGFGNSKVKIVFYHEGKFTVFFMVDKNTNRKCSDFYYLKW